MQMFVRPLFFHDCMLMISPQLSLPSARWKPENKKLKKGEKAPEEKEKEKEKKKKKRRK